MSVIREACRELAEALRADDHIVHDHVPEELVAPAIVLQLADRFLVGDPDDETFDTDDRQLVVDLWLLVEVVTNEQAADDFADVLEHVAGNLPDAWGIDATERPGPVRTVGYAGHGGRVTVSRHITL